MSTELARPEAGALAPHSIYEVFAQMALDPAIDPARIGTLMELQFKAEERQAEKEFNAAFADLLPRLPRVVKKGVIDMREKGSMKFARYEDVDAALRPMYTEAGFSLSFQSRPTDKGILLVALLAHKSGHAKTSELQLPPDAGAGRNALQALGSALSYAKRYLTCNLFNIVTVGEDDDATAGDYITEKQRQNVEDLIGEIGGTDREKQNAVRDGLMRTFEIKALDALTKSAYPAAINMLVAKRRMATK